MSNYINKQSKKFAQNYEKKINASMERNEATYSNKDLEKDLREMKSYEKSNNLWTYLRAHSKRGIYCSWKDDNFFRWALKEIQRPRTFPFFVAGATLFFSLFAMKQSKEQLYESQLYSRGFPQGSKLPHRYADLVDVHSVHDRYIGEAPIHVQPKYQTLKNSKL